MPRILVILLILLSLCVTALIGLTVYARYTNAAPTMRIAVEHDPNEADPPVLFDVPPFALTERSGQPVTRDDLLGKVWIADFIFTRCAGTCPLLSMQMAALQKELRQRSDWDKLRLVSFSVDPDNDTPAVLREYADRPIYQADATHWLFLTGPKDAVWSLIKDGFKLHVAENLKDTAMPLSHSNAMVLVDKRGRVRGTYQGVNSDFPDLVKEDHDRLLRDLDKVFKE